MNENSDAQVIFEGGRGEGNNDFSLSKVVKSLETYRI